MTDRILGCLGLILAMALQGAAFADPPATTVDLVTHNEILVLASPGRLWPLVVEPSAWKKGAKLVSVGGPVGQQGERFRAVMSDGQIAFYAENVEVVAEHRRTIRLNTADGRLIGYAVWQLTAQGTETRVQYDVYSEVPFASDDGTPAQQEAAKAAYREANYKRFADELAALKALAEGT